VRFLRAFWITIGQEFHAIDRLRLDKYLFLIRCYVGVAFEVFLKGKINNKSEQQQELDEEDEDDGSKKRKRKDDTKIGKNGKRRKQEEKQPQQDEENGDEKWTELESYISLLEEGPLCPLNFDHSEKYASEDSISMPHGPDGLRYHLTDIWLDELEKVITQYDSNKKQNEGKQNAEEEEEEGEKLKDYLDVPIELLLRPFEKLKTESPTKSVRRKVTTEVLEDERLVEWGFREKPVEDEEDEEEDEWNGLDD
jgi:ribosomal RNA-processing protein 1